jgi:hypothetical protein
MKREYFKALFGSVGEYLAKLSLLGEQSFG